MTELIDRAQALLAEHSVIDGHNDLPWVLRTEVAYDLDARNIARPQPDQHTDIPRLRAGGVGGQFWSVFVPSTLHGDDAVSATLEQVDCVYALCRRYPDTFKLARTANEVEAVMAAGKIASLIGMEGGHSIASSLGTLRMFAELGARYLTLTHNKNVPWADSATDAPEHGGLTDFGRSVVREMNKIGVLVDLSHVAPTTMADALDVSSAPVIFSHSSARALCDHPRDVPDAILQRLPANGGVCMVTFVPSFVSQACADWGRTAMQAARDAGHDPDDPESSRPFFDAWVADHPRPDAHLTEVADHVEHVATVAGVDHVGLGGDYDGTPFTPIGLEDVSGYPALVAELLRRGWSDTDVAALTNRNILRTLHHAEASANDHVH